MSEQAQGDLRDTIRNLRDQIEDLQAENARLNDLREREGDDLTFLDKVREENALLRESLALASEACALLRVAQIGLGTASAVAPNSVGAVREAYKHLSAALSGIGLDWPRPPSGFGIDIEKDES